MLRYRRTLLHQDIEGLLLLLTSAENKSNNGTLRSEETNDGGTKNVAIRARAFMLPESFFVRMATERVSFASSWVANASIDAMRCLT